MSRSMVFQKMSQGKVIFWIRLRPRFNHLNSCTVAHAVQISTSPSCAFTSHQSQWRSLTVFSASLDGASYPTFTF